MLIGYDLQSLTELASKSALLSSSGFFTEAELDYGRGRPDAVASLGGLLCAKEAFAKAVSGLEDCPSFTYPQFEVTHLGNGRPVPRVHGELARWLGENGLHVDLSISHSAGFAAATVLVLKAQVSK